MIMIAPNVINDASLVSSSVAETEYPAFSPTASYGLDVMVVYVAPDIHRVYKSLVAANVGNLPPTSPTKWLEMGSTNRWAMFDELVGSQTSAFDIITVTISFNNFTNAVALLNTSAAIARFVMTVPMDGVVYDKTISLVSSAGINDPYRYFFYPIRRISDYYVSDLPPYPAGTITVTLTTFAGGTVSCGALVAGLAFDLGPTKYAPKLSIDNYTVFTRNGFGQLEIQQREFNRKGDFLMEIDADDVDFVYHTIAQYRAKVCVYAGTSQYASSIILGVIESFSLEIQSAKHSVHNLTIKGNV